eukprot:gene6261-7262_t
MDSYGFGKIVSRTTNLTHINFVTEGDDSLSTSTLVEHINLCPQSVEVSVSLELGFDTYLTCDNDVSLERSVESLSIESDVVESHEYSINGDLVLQCRPKKLHLSVTSCSDSGQPHFGFYVRIAPHLTYVTELVINDFIPLRALTLLLQLPSLTKLHFRLQVHEIIDCLANEPTNDDLVVDHLTNDDIHFLDQWSNQSGTSVDS